MSICYFSSHPIGVLVLIVPVTSYFYECLCVCVFLCKPPMNGLDLKELQAASFTIILTHQKRIYHLSTNLSLRSQFSITLQSLVMPVDLGTDFSISTSHSCKILIFQLTPVLSQTKPFLLIACRLCRFISRFSSDIITYIPQVTESMKIPYKHQFQRLLSFPKIPVH